MNIAIFLRKLVAKFVSIRKLVFLWHLRNRNLRIVRKQPSKLRYSQGKANLPETEAILQLARECFLREGFYPISFSWPRKFDETHNPKSKAISTTVPYVPYSFEDENRYYGEYSVSALAITQKKGGWDCFRHLEIIGSGSVPLFLDIDKIPKYTMIHYPKDLFRAVRRNYKRHSLLPNHDVTTKLINYANRNLTTQAMCLYFSELANLSVTSQDRILFVDSKLSSAPDYLSVFNFIGLKQVYGDQVECLYEEPEYVYLDYNQDVSKLYGRGFGYTKVLNRSNAKSKPAEFPTVTIISNLAQDFRIVRSLKIQYPKTKFVLFWGQDVPIPYEIKEEVLRLTQGILFCREIY